MRLKYYNEILWPEKNCSSSKDFTPSTDRFYCTPKQTAVKLDSKALFSSAKDF